MTVLLTNRLMYPSALKTSPIGQLVDQPVNSNIPKSCPFALGRRYPNPSRSRCGTGYAAMAALRFGRLVQTQKAGNLIYRNLQFSPLVTSFKLFHRSTGLGTDPFPLKNFY